MHYIRISFLITGVTPLQKLTSSKFISISCIGIMSVIAILMCTHTIYHFQYGKKHPKLSQICSYGIFFKGLKTTAVVNEPSVFEPLKFYCILTPRLPVLLPMSRWNCDLSLGYTFLHRTINKENVTQSKQTFLHCITRVV